MKNKFFKDIFRSCFNVFKVYQLPSPIYYFNIHTHNYYTANYTLDLHGTDSILGMIQHKMQPHGPLTGEKVELLSSLSIIEIENTKRR